MVDQCSEDKRKITKKLLTVTDLTELVDSLLITELFGDIHRPHLPDHRDLDLSGVGHLLLDLPGNVPATGSPNPHRRVGPAGP